MKSKVMSLFVFLVTLLIVVPCVSAQTMEYLDGKSLTEVVRGRLQPVSSGPVSLPLITWGGDVATVLADTDGIFKAEGLDVRLFVENNFQKQVEGVLAGKTPYLRGTMGMINAAAEVFKREGVDLVVVHQLTWSNGGDTIVAKANIKNPSDLRGKTIGLQLYGPHMDYVLNILKSAGVQPSEVKFKWLRELTLPTYNTTKAVDPVTAFQKDPTLDAVMVINPDAQLLTSGGKIGTGADGSVKGAHILLSTKTGTRIIADVYAVRSDYADAHRAEVQKMTHALMRGQEALTDLVKTKTQNQAKFSALMSKSATLLFDAAQLTAETEGLLEDCEFVGYSGNVAFFTGKGTTRSFKTLTDEIQPAFRGIGLMSARVALLSAEWDYAALAVGLRYATNIPAPVEKFDRQKVEASVARKISVEPTTWADKGTLFLIEINFEPNQSDFTGTQYAADFTKAIGLAETYGGSLVIIEGHSDPLGILRAKEQGEKPQVITQMEQQSKNLSLERSRSVQANFIAYAKSKGLRLDESHFVAVGLGASVPKYSPPKTQEEWAANRRVVFRIKQVEAEATEFVPLAPKK